MAQWNKGKPWSELTKEKISIARKGLLNWITDKKLSGLLIRDFAVGNLCLKYQLNKPAIILYSGVLEATLNYVTKLNNTNFDSLIEESFRRKFISESNKNKLHVLRDFRNYVHIYKEAQGDFELTGGISQLAKETCEAVLKGLKDYKD